MRELERGWLWMAALDALTRTERLRRDPYQPRAAVGPPSWEPPVDVFETEHEVLIIAALPGVAPDRIDACIEDGRLRLRGERDVPEAIARARVHRLEMPVGRFERSIPLPPGRYGAINHAMKNGCLFVHLAKA